ncbi:MAG: RNA polymerase sigma factor [Gammaproteobacteria bacterium]
MTDWLRGIQPRELVARLRARRANTSAQDIEDALQDVLLNIQRKLQSEAPPPMPDHPDAFIIKSVINRLNSMYRARRRLVSDVSDESLHRQLHQNDLGDTHQPEQKIEARERAQLFAHLVALIDATGEPRADDAMSAVFFALQCRLKEELTDQQWILLRMRALHGRGYQDCADALGISLGSAHNWTRRTLTIVRECLEQFGTAAGALDYDDD